MKYIRLLPVAILSILMVAGLSAVLHVSATPAAVMVVDTLNSKAVWEAVS